MTQPIQLTEQVFAVEVPEDLQGRKPEYHFQPSITDLINERKGDSELIISFELKACGLPRIKQSVKLPGPSNWQLICTTKEVTNEKLALIFGHPFIGEVYARESLNALLTSKELDPENKNYVLIKKVS